MEVKEIPISKIIGSLCRMRLEKDYEREELLLDIVEDEYEKDPVVRKLWKKSVVVRRSRGGDKITIEFSGPFDLLDKYDALSAPLKKAKKRFRTVMGRDAKIP